MAFSLMLNEMSERQMLYDLNCMWNLKTRTTETKVIDEENRLETARAGVLGGE